MTGRTSESEIQQQLKHIAQDAGARIKSILREDANAPGTFKWKCAFKREGYQIECACNDTMFSIEIRGFNTPISFRLGKRDPWGTFTHPVKARLEGASLRVYVEPERASDSAFVAWINDSGNLGALNNLRLGGGDTLQVHGMQLAAYVRPRGDIGNIELLDLMIALIRRFPAEPATKAGYLQSADGIDFDREKIPPSLRHLVPLIRQWSIGDDERRSEKIDEASTQELRRFWKMVSPHLAEIEKFLTSFEGKPQPPEAIVLFWLKTAAIEAEPTVDLWEQPPDSGPVRS